jgi:hypothetical protein
MFWLRQALSERVDRLECFASEMQGFDELVKSRARIRRMG